MNERQEHIMEHVGGAEKWKDIVDFFGELSETEILAELDKMYPHDDNDDLAALIAKELNVPMTPAEMGRKGGRSTSAAKQAAARTNGRKGGRPRKE
jgi:hypothetical protein